MGPKCCCHAYMMLRDFPVLTVTLVWHICRGAMLAMLQSIASSQQDLSSQPRPSPSPSPGTVPSSAAVALQQRQLQQLLYQHQQQQPHNACQIQSSQQNLAASAQAAACATWPWQPSPPPAVASAISATPTITEPVMSPPVFAQTPESLSAVTVDQQACPRLDGSFLAECIKPSVPLPCMNGCNQPNQMPSPLPTRQVLSASHIPAVNAGLVQMQADQQPSASIVSPTLSFSSAHSTNSSISAVPTLRPSPESQLPVDLCSADASFDSFGMYPHDSSALPVLSTCVIRCMHVGIDCASIHAETSTSSQLCTWYQNLFAWLLQIGLGLQSLILLMSCMFKYMRPSHRLTTT